MSAGKDIGPEAAAYAAELRVVVHGFTARGGTQKEIAVSAHVAPATLSRYLSGERIAPRHFVAALDSFLTQRGQPFEARVLSRLQDLCRRAHEASGSPAVRLAHLQEELAQVRTEKGAKEAELAAVQEHADQLAAELGQALEQVRGSEQRRLALERRVTDQGRNLQHAQAYTRQLEADLTALQEQVVLIQREVKVLRRQNELLITEEGPTYSGSRSKVKVTVSGESTQATDKEGKPSQSTKKTSRGGEKRGRPWRLKAGKLSPPGTQATPHKKTPVFVASWTGDEDPREFTTNPHEWLLPMLLCVIALFFFRAAIDDSAKDNQAWGYIIAGACLVLAALLAEDKIPPSNTKKLISARTLRLDGTGLTASDPSGKQHLSWASIKKISIHHTPERINDRRPLALNVQLEPETPDAARTYRFAGWPLRLNPPDACRRPPKARPDEWVPVCVLGPLTGPDKTELQNTLAAYLETPAEGIWSN
ncbi:hypothetical protein AB0M38_31380 [Streptomyces sp. NPDC051742]|uniref:helix-turn-helix domain-containing protein n=1 Tax=unclassified Streptomyces TaxID=2593676 RepID=UPI003438F66A